MSEDDREILEEQRRKIPFARPGLARRKLFPAAEDMLTTVLGIRGGEKAARKLPVSECADVLTLSVGLEDALFRAYAIFEEFGGLLAPDGDYALPVLASMTRSGFADMNPAVVLLEFEPAENGTVVYVLTAAKEGLIKQKTAQKAAARMRELLGGGGL